MANKEIQEKTWQTVIQNTVGIEGHTPLDDEKWNAWLNYELSDKEQKQELKDFFKEQDVIDIKDVKRFRTEVKSWVKAYLSLTRGESYPFFKAFRLLCMYEQLLQQALKDAHKA